jgi:hypothetical protein
MFYYLFLVLGMEIVGGPWKTYVGIGVDMPWSLGYSILPGIAFLLRVSLQNQRIRQPNLTEPNLT